MGSGTQWGVARPKLEPRRPVPGFPLPRGMSLLGSVGTQMCQRTSAPTFPRSATRIQSCLVNVLQPQKGGVLVPSQSGDVSVCAHA